jgi:hypothetical protein
MILFDHDSADNYTEEVAPWLRSGFVSIRNVSELVANPHITSRTPAYWRVMHMKRQQEMLCMKWGLEHGYDYHISVDMDEYMFPLRTPQNHSLVDIIDRIFNKRKVGVVPISKMTFNPSPHLLEPIDLLTIEAYQTRYPHVREINYYMTVQPKVIYWLSRYKNDNKSMEFLLSCCGFHGCEVNFENKPVCRELVKSVGRNFGWMGGSSFVKIGMVHGLQLNHYTRSLEKFALKQKTWQTAASRGENKYEIAGYLHRTYGWTHDDSAARLSCAVRREIARATGSSEPYVRPGEDWYRNPEFGRVIKDPSRRGRGNGRLHVTPPEHPYHYGKVQQEYILHQGQHQSSIGG